MSRSELAEAVNDHLWRTTGKHYALDAHTIARYERGKVRWPSAAYRTGLKAVLGVGSEQGLGLWPQPRGRTSEQTWVRGSGGVSGCVRHEEAGGLSTMAVAEIRRIAAGFDAPEDGPVRSVAELQADVERCVRFRVDSQYSRLMRLLPQLIPELTRALFTSPEPCTAARFLTQAYRAADAVVNKLGFYDLSSRVVQVMLWVAEQSEDAVTQASASYVRGEEFFSTRDYRTGLTILEAATDQIAGGSARERASLGALHMRAGIMNARAGDPDRAQEHLNEAAQLAEHVPEGIYSGTAFGAGSVRVHDVTLALDMHDPVRALALAAGWIPPRRLPAERTSHFYIDVARAQSRVSRPETALKSLDAALRSAPEHTRHHPHVRTLLDQMMINGGGSAEQARAFARQAEISASAGREAH